MKSEKQVAQRGFTFVELIIVVSILATLTALITLSLVHIQRKTSITTSISSIIADTRGQQIKAMVGDTEGRSSPDNYGVYLGTNSYSLFHGTVYSASDSANYLVSLDSSLQFATPGASIIFTRLSGNILNYSATASAIVIRDTTDGEQKTIQFNQYGVITGVN